ncbi:MAG: hypothetical protein RLZZ444_1333 [Pseudomonadota bacterium]|jgi:hypothetical protein
MMRLRPAIPAFILFLASFASAQAAESTYTDLDLDKCETLAQGSPDEPGGDWISLKCGGYQNYPVYFDEGDLRQSVYFGHLSQKILDEANETFGPFNHVGKRVEWRIGTNGKPYAAILRFFIENVDESSGMPTKASEGQVLVISRVGQPQDKTGCVVGYVDALANPDANILARGIADEMAANFRCGRDKPDYHGVKGPKAGDPAYVFPTQD